MNNVTCWKDFAEYLKHFSPKPMAVSRYKIQVTHAQNLKFNLEGSVHSYEQ